MSGLNLKMIVTNAAFDTQKERKYVAQKGINITRCKICIFRITLYCFWKFVLTLKGFQSVEKGKYQAHRHEGRKKHWRATAWSTSSWFPGRSWRIPRINKFSWKTFPNMSKTRGWLETTTKYSARGNYTSPVWILWLGAWFNGWGGRNGYLCWLKQGIWHGNT